MKVVNVYARRGNLRIVGNRKAIREIAERMLASLVAGHGETEVHNTKGDLYTVTVEIKDGIADLVRLPLPEEGR